MVKFFTNKKVKITLLILSSLFVLSLILIVFLPKKSIIESVKRQIATTFVYEYIPNQNIDVTTTEAYKKKDSLYLDFRKNYRFPIQIIGFNNFSDSSKIFLISEPPPKLEIDSLHSIFNKFTHQIEIKKHKIGYDGFVKDIVIILSNATNENIENLLKKLTKELFYSAYKPFTINLSQNEKKVFFSKSNLDYQITLSEFEEWFLNEQEEFTPYNDSTESLTIQEILSKKRVGVFFSKLPGFVAWSIDKHQDLLNQIENIRPFTLDADLILGAFSDSNTLVIIGREREATVQELPPLRIETITLLASITKKELSQSLDINDFLAGKMSNGHDWCPTYLSNELENTELGDLLTLTDIILKDWSESGMIKENYYRYPHPSYYPFDKPLFKKLGLNELVYNWNTNDAMYAIDYDSVTIYTLNRTGSLPVSYFNSQERSYSIGAKYENRAYHYFATLNNCDLARVVQYTALYQLFIDNNIQYSGNTHSVYPKNKPYLLLKPTLTLLEILENLSQADIDKISDSIARKHFNEIHKERILEQITKDEINYHFQTTDDNKIKIFDNFLKNYKREMASEFNSIKRLLANLNEDDFKKLARQLAYPRGTSKYSKENYQIYLKSRTVNSLLRSIGKNNLPLLGVDLKNIKDYFSNSLSQNSAKYLKTPSLIITFNDFYTTGGHNLSSKISRVKNSSHYKRNYRTGGDFPRSESTPPPISEKPKSPTVSSPRPTTSTAKKGSSSSMGKETQKKQTTTKSSTTARSRGSVISNSPRTQRGF